VAVLKAVTAKRPDNLQQVAPPSELFHNPANLFVAGFMGSPAMNMVNAHIEGSGEDVHVVFGPYRLKVDPKAIESHPGLDGFMNTDLVVGFRPGDFEDARVAADGADRSMEIDVDVTEVLGSETFIHYEVPVAPVITPEIEELLADSGGKVSSLGDTTRFSSRVSSDISIPPGSKATVVVDTAKMHFFDPESGKRIGYREWA